jgi:low affinity Fe/Cu permease
MLHRSQDPARNVRGHRRRPDLSGIRTYVADQFADKGCLVTKNWFSQFSTVLSTMAGRPGTFMIAAALVVVWAASGPLFHFSDTWQLVINTSTTIITFLMVFLIQNTQNRDTAAMQIKLDELIRALSGAHNALLDLEELGEKDLTRFRKRYEQLAEDARVALRSGGTDTDSPFIEDRPDNEDKDDAQKRPRRDPAVERDRQQEPEDEREKRREENR